MIIQLLNGMTYDIESFNLRRLFHRIPSLDINHTTASVENRSDIITNSKFNNRVITVELLYEAQDIQDYYLLRDELNALLMRTEPFYIIFKKEPHKRYLVKTNSQFEIPPNAHMESFEIEFLTINPYGESTFTTLEYENKEWDSGQYAWSGMIDWDTETFPNYTFNTTEFTVYNAGSVRVDPRKDYLVINVRSTGNQLGITNDTTGETYLYNFPTFVSNYLTIDGVKTIYNAQSMFRVTNKKLISLAPGENRIRIFGSTNFQSISFDFRYLYK